MKRYQQLFDIVGTIRPKTIVEVGVHNAHRGAQMSALACALGDGEVTYVGYDLFDDATPETNAREMNGKGAGSEAKARALLDQVKARFPGFSYLLIRGDTRETLHPKPMAADLAFIDGGHSVETIRGDYEALKGSKVIAFDDWYEGGPDTALWGCNQVVAPLDHTVLPQADPIRHGGFTRIAVVPARWHG